MREFLESALHEHSESPLHERLYSVPPPTTQWQVLLQKQQWHGIRPFRFYPGRGSTWRDVQDDITRLAVCRSRYKTKVQEYTGKSQDQDPPYTLNDTSYTNTDSLSGAGNAPTASGGPEGWLPGSFPSGARAHYSMIPGNYFATEVSPSGVEENSATATTRDWNNLGYGIGGGYMVSLSETLSDENSFSPILTSMKTRLLARDWTEPVNWIEDNCAAEALDEWQQDGTHLNIPTVNPATYSGAWGTAPNRNEHIGRLWTDIPEITAKPNNGIPPLASYWLYPEWDDFYADYPNEAWHAFTRSDIYARRLRFRLLNLVVPVDYFIAFGVLTAKSDVYTGYDTAELHHTCKVISSGTIVDDTPVEVTFPYVEGFAAFSDFIQVGNNLTCGAVAFAIFDETPAEWSTRTGINVVPTVDSPLFTTDDTNLTTDEIP